MGFWDMVLFSFLIRTLIGYVFSVWLLLMAQMVRNPPAIWETQVRSLSQEDPLEKGMETHSRILAWRIPWTKEPSPLLQFMGSQSFASEF